MKTITTTINLYKYEELNETAKKKVRAHYKDSYLEVAFECFAMDRSEELRKLKFEGLDFNYNFNYCQGDGFTVFGRVFIDDILENEEIKNQFTEKEIKKLIHINDNIDYKIEIKENAHYYFLSESSIDALVYCNYYQYRKKDCKELEAVMNKLEDVLFEYLDNYCAYAEEEGYNILEDTYSFEQNIIANEYDYLEDGTLY